MGFRMFCLQTLMKYSLNDTIFRPKSVSCFINFSTAGGTQSKKTLIKIVKPELTIEDNGKSGKNKLKEIKKTEKRRRTTANVVTPSFDEVRRKELQTVVGLHVGLSTIYWAKIRRCGNVLDWSHKELFPIAEMSRKMQLPKLYEEMYSILENLPFGDVYILEGTNHGQPNSLQSSSPSASAAAILRAQILAMLVALLNTRVESEIGYSDPQQDLQEELDYLHKVYLLRPRLMSRLFHLLVGTERVSALVLVDSILDGSRNSKLTISDVMGEAKICEESSKENSDSPPIFTPVTVPLSIKESYRRLRAVEREGMCQALLIAMTFYDLVIFKDPKVLTPLQL